MATLAMSSSWPMRAERRLRDERLLEVRADEACGCAALGFDHAGIYRVDADLLWAELLCEHAGDGVDRALRSGVDRAVGRGEAADDRSRC